MSIQSVVVFIEHAEKFDLLEIPVIFKLIDKRVCPWQFV